MRLSGLEQMRVARDQREAAITAPFRERLTGERRRADEAVEAHRQFERTVGTDIGKMMLDEMKHEMAAAAHRHFRDNPTHQPAREEYARRSLPGLRMGLFDDVAHTKTVQIDVPSLHLRTVIRS